MQDWLPDSATGNSARWEPRCCHGSELDWCEADAVLCVSPPPLEAVERLAQGSLLVGLLAPYGAVQADGSPQWSTGLFHRPGAAPPHQPGPVDGCAFLPGQHRRIQGCSGGGGGPGSLRADADDGGRHHPAVPGAGARGGSGRPPGPGHRPSPGGCRLRLRRAAGGEGTGGIPWGPVHRPSHHRGHAR